MNDRYPPLDMSPQQLRNRILDASVAVIEAMAAQNPVLLVLEDAHWIDPTSLDMLSMAVDRSRSARIFLVITARPEFVHPWAGQAHLTALALNRLGRRECTEMIDRVTEGKALPGEVVDHIVAKTDGVPLFVEELTKTVVESGLLEEADDRYLLNGPLPPLAIPVSLQDSLMARLDRLAPVKEVAQLAAVIGRTFGHDLLAAISPLGENELTDAVTQLVEAGLVYSRGLPPEAIYEFKHALVQDAAYESLLISTRQEYHQTIARTLEERFPHLVEAEPELLAHHYTEAGLNEEAVPYWQDAGERAAQTSANVEAIQHLTKGLALVERLAEGPDRDARELDLWMTLIAPLATARGYSAPEMERAFTRALALCQQLGDTERIFPILYGRWAYHYAGGQVTRCRELAVDFLELAEGQQDPIPRLAGQRILGTASMMNGDPVAARQHLEEALAGFDPEAHGSLSQSYVQDLGVSILSYSALTLSFLGYPDRAAARAREALARARAADHLNTLVYTLFHVGLFLPWLMRDAETLESNVEQVIAISSEHAIPMWLGAGKIFRGAIVRQAGGLEAALAESDEGSEMLQAIQFELLRGLSCLLRAKNLAELGRVDDAAQWLDDGLSVAEASGEHWIEA